MEKLNEILVKIFKISTEEATRDLNMKDVDRWDSLTHMELIVEIENEFNIQISGDDIAEMIAFGAIRTTVAKHIN
jgi:acyl carrier protein